MKRSCTWCGRFHEYGEECPHKPKKEKHKYYKHNKEFAEFRGSKEWKIVREEVKERDHYLCQACLHGLGMEIGRKINYKQLSVHHIVPLEEDWNKRSEHNNLVTLCSFHHEQAERGEISREALLNCIKATRKGRAVHPPGGKK